MNRVASNRSNLIARMFFVTAASAIAFSAAACAVEDQVETEDDVTAVQQEFRSGAATGVISAPPPAPVPVTCVLPSPLGSVKDVTEEQCKKLLSIAGCPKAGAVVNDKMKCSTTG